MEEMNREIKYIVVTGVECSGKSTMCKDLAAHYNEPLVAEVARKYLAEKVSYDYDDIEAIARLQWAEIVKQGKVAKQYLFIDTAFYVLKIWSEEKYGKCCRFILDKLASFEVYLYLLPNFTIPYEADVLREAPDEKERARLYMIYMEHLVGERFAVIDGTKKERLAEAVGVIGQ